MIWTEKYRPQRLDEIQGHDKLVRCFRSWLASPDDMPNAMLIGPPGVGKTAIIHAFARELYGDDFRYDFIEFNSSDARKLSDVREKINTETRYGSKSAVGFRMIYLGELDGMDGKAQDAFKRIMELAHHNVRWIADCNGDERIIEAVRSRFTPYTLKKLPRSVVVQQLSHIATNEGVICDEDVLNYIVDFVKGDLRNAILMLAGLPRDGEAIDDEFIRSICPTPTHAKVLALTSKIWKGDWKEIEPIFQDLVHDDPSCKRIIEIMYDGFLNNDMPAKKKWPFLALLGDYEVRIKQAPPQHQFRCLIYEMKALYEELKNTNA